MSWGIRYRDYCRNEFGSRESFMDFVCRKMRDYERSIRNIRDADKYQRCMEHMNAGMLSCNELQSLKQARLLEEHQLRAAAERQKLADALVEHVAAERRLSLIATADAAEALGMTSRQFLAVARKLCVHHEDARCTKMGGTKYLWAPETVEFVRKTSATSFGEKYAKSKRQVSLQGGAQ